MNIPNMDTPMARLVVARGRLYKSEEEVAAATGINECWYYALEHYEEELTYTISVLQLAKLCKVTDISIEWLLTGVVGGIYNTPSPLELTLLIKNHLDSRGVKLEEFEEKIECSIGSVLEHPDRMFEEWNAECLKQVCDQIGVNWVEMLPLID